MKRLPVNLATLPFESVQQARRVLVIGSIAFAALTLLHGAVAFALWRVDATGVDTDATHGVAARVGIVEEWEQEVERLTSVAQPANSRRLAESVALANELISWRTLPWDPLFAALENALPEDVRLEAVQPVSEDDGVHVDLTAAATARSRLDSFLARLEEQPSLRRVYPTFEEIGTDGRYRMRISAMYDAPGQGVPAER